MFEKLIETDSGVADLKGRGRYFVVSTIVVGILFVSAVVFSIYAAEIDLGIGELDSSRILAPVITDEVLPDEPETARTHPQNSSLPTTDVIQRTAHIANINETQNAPTSVSVTPNTQLARPADGIYTIGRYDSNGAGANGPGNLMPGSGNSSPGTGSGGVPQRVAAVPDPPKPPPAAVKKPAPPRSIGVVNSIAIRLPKPPYPAAARQMRAEGDVQVQVTIDEQGNVISARSLDGHRLLRTAAENAARRAKFTPTLLSKVPIKVTGIIIYKFHTN